MKLLCGLMALACAPAALAGNGAPIPKESVVGFVAEKLDVTTLPSATRPKPQKSKKTFGDYGYVTRQVDEKQIHAETAPGGAQINITILELKASAIYVCVEGQRQKATSGQIQRVVLLKMKNANGFLKGRESSREFDVCPVIGDGDSTGDSYGGG
jgi:hypothetical protein